MKMNSPTVPQNYVPHVHEDELVKALRLIHHATAPTHDDGAYHEAAHDIADEMLRRVDARAAYVALWDAARSDRAMALPGETT